MDCPVPNQKDGPESCRKDGPLSHQKDAPISSQDGPVPAASQQDDGEGYRHTNSQRKNIRRGRTGLSAATGQSDILGNSRGNHRISASVTPTNDSYLVYVGKLSVNTTSDDLRCHLADIGVNDVADVIKLNTRFKHKESSVCASLHNELCMTNMFNSVVWPAGIIVRPYRPARSNNNRGRSNYNRPRHGNHPHGQRDGRNTSRPSYQSEYNYEDSRRHDGYTGVDHGSHWNWADYDRYRSTSQDWGYYEY
jgi:hypothetical protein